jgi:hypothetical protein
MFAMILVLTLSFKFSTAQWNAETHMRKLPHRLDETSCRVWHIVTLTSCVSITKGIKLDIEDKEQKHNYR